MSTRITYDQAYSAWRDMLSNFGMRGDAEDKRRFLLRVVELQALQELGLHAVSPPPVNLEEEKWGPLPEEFRSPVPKLDPNLRYGAWYYLSPGIGDEILLSYKTKLTSEELQKVELMLSQSGTTFSGFMDQIIRNWMQCYTPLGGQSSPDVPKAGGGPPSDIAKKL